MYIASKNNNFLNITNIVVIVCLFLIFGQKLVKSVNAVFLFNSLCMFGCLDETKNIILL